jgi:hypothetical protein
MSSAGKRFRFFSGEESALCIGAYVSQTSGLTMLILKWDDGVVEHINSKRLQEVMPAEQVAVSSEQRKTQDNNTQEGVN